MTNDANITQMFWQPDLIALNHIAIATCPAHSCFIDPSKIDAISKGEVKISNKETGEECFLLATYVSLSTGKGLWVSNEPQQVNMLRAKALGKAPVMLEPVK